MVVMVTADVGPHLGGQGEDEARKDKEGSRREVQKCLCVCTHV